MLFEPLQALEILGWLMHRFSPHVRCIRCIRLLPSGARPGALCQDCQNYTPQDEPPPRPFDIRPRDPLLMLVSGGKDGIATLGWLRQRFPHNDIVALHIDNGLYGPQVLKNVRQAAERTHTQVFIESDHVGQFRIMWHQAFLDLSDDERRSTFDHVDRADGDLIFTIGQSLARRLGRRLVSGLSTAQLATIQPFILEDETALFPLDYWRPTEAEIIRQARAVAGPGCSFDRILTNSLPVIAMLYSDLVRLGYIGLEREMSLDIRAGRADRQKLLYTVEGLHWLFRHGWLERPVDRALHLLNLTHQEIT